MRFANAGPSDEGAVPSIETFSSQSAGNRTERPDPDCDQVPGTYRDHGAQGPRQDDLARAQMGTARRHGAGQPEGGTQGVTQAGSASSNGHLLAVFIHGHANLTQRQAAEGYRLIA
jgi:hypothetical protein